MCGIGLCVTFGAAGSRKSCASSLNCETVKLLIRRGPEGIRREEVKLTNTTWFALTATVLGFRGRQLTQQPAKDELGNMLAWNGEIFNNDKAQSLQVPDKKCDTTVLLHRLSQSTCDSDLLNTMSRIEGPWAFVYFKSDKQQLWFGRDVFGRRSLLYRIYNNGLALASVVHALPDEIWRELPADGIYCLNLNRDLCQGSRALRLFPWHRLPAGDLFEPCSSNSHPLKPTLVCSVDPGISSLLNKELGSGPPPMPPLGRDFFKKVVENHQEIQSALYELDGVLLEAVRRRLSNHMMVCQRCVHGHREGPTDTPQCNHASVAVLFSGGLDSMVVAAMCARVLPGSCPIDLLNVAFEHEVHIIDSQSKTKKWFKSFDAPDRLSAKLGVDELRAAFPQHQWNLVEIDVNKEELQFDRAYHIHKLIYPLETVLDDSLGCALWFAARGSGKISGNPYTSPARVVFVGMGADEQLGGYSRHMIKYKNSGWEGLIEEISSDLNRIAERNLGRDDRIISDHGREGRFPFLDRDVVSFLNRVPIWMKVNPHLPRGIGDKMLLRALAASLHLDEAACRPKRAMQFGTRVVRAEEDRAKGGDICQKLMDMELGSVPESEKAYWKM
ncbi:asparagine synthetase domain-containing protein 1 [Rhipicephalus microplus]|uniref:asparagine synthetase domain-containing protein 1 n=1 Tax=Rhipicephalus microplus TaxID=6941 RepID=UPI003F6B07A8